MRLSEKIFGPKVAGTRVVPLTTKIIMVFAVFILVSNLSSNYINLTMTKGEMLGLANRILVKDMKELFRFASNQYDIFEFSRDENAAKTAIESAALREMQGERSAAMAIKADGSVLLWASKMPKPSAFEDPLALAKITGASKDGINEGKFRFSLNGKNYFSVYKYHNRWDAYFIRAEEEKEFYADADAIFLKISLIILATTAVCLALGVILLHNILKFVARLTSDLMRMQVDQKLELIDISGAPNDEVTYLGASFNALSSTINNLLGIFRRFVTKDIAQKAYSERSIRLEGTTKELTILFSDIKGFTFMTETLGNDIIDVLNLHYDRAIRNIHANEGIVGSIIGDALLAVFGTLPSNSNKSLEALEAARHIQDVAADLRKAMTERSNELVTQHGSLGPIEEKVLKAVLLEVGVGIDAGDVFYGNIGSYERMTNTVIGDNVNSASRLEGLTRIYQVPIICSQSVRDEALKAGPSSPRYRFVELDTVQVKGKLQGKKVYWPLPTEKIDADLSAQLDRFEAGLQLYYKGDWAEAKALWQDCFLPMLEEFELRLAGGKPENWNGIWAMQTK